MVAVTSFKCVYSVAKEFFLLDVTLVTKYTYIVSVYKPSNV